MMSDPSAASTTALALPPLVDWPELPESVSDGAAARMAGARAYERIRRDLAAACDLRGVLAWINAKAEAGDRLRADLVRCLVAADYWNARMACPKGRELSRSEGSRYMRRRLDAADTVCARALARWAVLECVPVRWIPEGDLRAALDERLRLEGLDGRVTSLTLVPPVAGGAEWVRRDCPYGVAAVLERARGAATAAMFHWAKGTAPALVLQVGSTLRAFDASGQALSLDGGPLGAGELVAAEPLDGDSPPVPWFYRLAMLVGVGGWIWRLIRWRRSRQGGKALGSHQ